MQDTADRIREKMNELNIKQADIQRATGAGKATISSWVKGATLPSSEYISKLASVLKSDVNWLLTGEGSMTDSTATFERDEPARDVIQRLITGANDHSELRSIPYLDAAAACGHDRLNNDFPEVIGRYEISAEFLERLGLPSSGDGLILIDSDGDSMAPTIPSGTPLLVNTKEKDLSTLVTGKIYVFCADGSLLCKRIFKEINNTLTIKADNPDKSTYADITVNRQEFNEFHILGRVKFAFVEL